MQSVMSIVNTKRSVKLSPGMQHIRLDPAQAQLRPPPAQIPAPSDIFTGLSVFRDGYRTKYPDSDERCLDENCKMVEAEWPDKSPCPYKDHIREDVHTASESRGSKLARHQQRWKQCAAGCDGSTLPPSNLPVLGKRC
ncbi:hypothetical protein PF005_g32940, partial [Phytophthora fragariae]